MKIEGVRLGEPAEKLICFPRTDPDSGEEYEIPFTIRAVLDFSDFERVCPEIKPAKKIMKGSKEPIDDFEEPTYVKKVFQRGTRRMEFMTIRSLEATEGLTWDKVKINEPATWELWRKELEEAGFTEMEIGRLHLESMRINSVTDDTMDEARENFLRKRAEKEEEDKEKDSQ